MSDIDLLLYRPIKDGAKYDKLIPKSKCEVTALGKGMTDFSVAKMAEWVWLTVEHMQEVAPLLQQRSLEDTCYTIHEWCYDHFQYKADKEDQLLRSPSCSWQQRYDGIDCKSYSITASTILINLGINHYLRRVKQPGFNPNLWTHVYVIVPVDQKTGSLDKGYYVIDGTVHPDEPETPYTEKSDWLMSMQHYGLMGAQPGLNGISLSSIKSIFSNGFKLRLSCIGGSTDSTDFDAAFQLVSQWFDSQFYNVNAAVRENSPNVMAEVNKLLTNATQIKDHAAHTRAYDWKSACTRDALEAYKKLGEYYYNMCYGAFKAWLENYFTTSYTTVTVKNNQFETPIRNSAGQGPDKNQFGRDVQVQILKSIALKATTKDIMRFEVTQYVAESAAGGGFDVMKMFQGITQVLASFNNTPAPTTTVPVNNGSGGGSGIKTGNGGTLVNGNTPASGGSGNGKIIGGVLLAGGIALLASGSLKGSTTRSTAKSRPRTPKRTPKRSKK